MHNPPTMPLDLLRRAANGERAARAALLERYGSRVWGLCRRLSPEPEDAYQEIWEKLFGRLTQFDPSGSASFGTWVSRVAHHHLIDRARSRGRKGQAVPLEALPPVAPTAERRAGLRMELAQVEEALMKLSEDQRRVVIAHCIHGVPLTELAQDEDVPVGTLKARLHRARAELYRRTRRNR